MSKVPDPEALPRGIRNHNPGNIRINGDAWKGLIEPDPEFFQFFIAEYGIRAMARILSNYERFYNLNTVNQIIWRWAPPDDGNATAIYADFVARKMGIKPDEVFNVRLNLLPLIKAMIEYENGQQPYSLETLTAGIALAVGDDS